MKTPPRLIVRPTSTVSQVQSSCINSEVPLTSTSGLKIRSARTRSILTDREHEVLPRLWTDIREFEKKMRRSSRTLRGRPGLSISPELRMSGQVAAATKTVKLLPRIWILYGHERWRKSVQKFVRE